MEPGIRTIHFVGQSTASGRLALVEYIDGTLGIMRNGQPLEGCHWAMGELDRSIQVFRDLSAKEKDEGEIELASRI